MDCRSGNKINDISPPAHPTITNGHHSLQKTETQPWHRRIMLAGELHQNFNGTNGKCPGWVAVEAANQANSINFIESFSTGQDREE